jgi:hypothetical protein
MGRSVAVAVASYLLSVVLVSATDPLPSCPFPVDFVKGRVPSDATLFVGTVLRWVYRSTKTCSHQVVIRASNFFQR